MGLSLDEGARLAGGHRWVEIRLFEILGGWVVSTPEADAKLMLDRHSQHHAWRAAQWWDRLPLLSDVDRSGLVEPPSPALGRAIDDLARLDGTVVRLAGAYRFALPRLTGLYDAHRRRSDPISDGSAIRTLTLVAADTAADWHEGEVLLQGLLTDPGAARAAADALARLDTLMVPAG